MNIGLLFVVHALAVYRVSRFVLMDTLVEGTRQRILTRLNVHDHKAGSWGHLWRDKLMELLTCPYCFTVWCSGVVVLVQHFAAGGLPYPILWWLGVAGASLVAWSIIED